MTLRAEPPTQWPEFGNSIVFEQLDLAQELLTACLEPLGDHFAAHENALEAKASRAISQGEAALDQFSEVGRVGVQHARALLLACYVALFCQQRQGMRRFHHPGQID